MISTTSELVNGERGIRTPEALPPTRFRVVRLHPLGHLSRCERNSVRIPFTYKTYHHSSLLLDLPLPTLAEEALHQLCRFIGKHAFGHLEAVVETFICA